MDSFQGDFLRWESRAMPSSESPSKSPSDTTIHHGGGGMSSTVNKVRSKSISKSPDPFSFMMCRKFGETTISLSRYSFAVEKVEEDSSKSHVSKSKSGEREYNIATVSKTIQLAVLNSYCSSSLILLSCNSFVLMSLRTSLRVKQSIAQDRLLLPYGIRNNLLL